MYSDIEIVDEIIESGCGTNIVAAWERIKKKLAEALKPSHNTESKPCPGCGCKTSSVDVRICPSCVSNFE